MDLPILSKEQTERLLKLEQEIVNKQKYEENHKARKEKSSVKTGIPYDLVDTDVVIFGTMLGIFRTADGVKLPSMLDIISGSNDVQPNYEKIPTYFNTLDCKITEEERLYIQRNYVSDVCQKYCNFFDRLVEKKLHSLGELCITLQTVSVDCFVSTIKENIQITYDMLLEDPADKELIDNLSVLYTSLLSCINICEYKKILNERIERIGHENLSYIDYQILLFPGFENMSGDASDDVSNELIIKSHEKTPELVPLKFPTIVKECCTLSIMFVDLMTLLVHCIIGPYMNNPITYVKDVGFYVLKSTTSDGLRCWILDEQLTFFSERLRRDLLKYTIKIFTIWWKESKKTKNNIYDNLTDTLSILIKPTKFRDMICNIIKTWSQWFPSELDVYDSVSYGHIPLVDIIDDVPDQIKDHIK